MRTDYRYMVSLRNVVISHKGVKPKILRGSEFKDSVPYLDINALEGGDIRYYTYKELGNLASTDDILVVWDGSRCGLPLFGKKGIIGSTIMGLTPVGVIPEYLYYFLKSKYDFINMNSTGTGIPHVDPNLFYDLNIPLVSLEDQKQIISNLNVKQKDNSTILNAQKKLLLESLQVQSDTTFENHNVEDLIKNIRDTIFNRAFSGELTSKWREKNGEKKTNWETQSLEKLSTLITSGSRDWAKYVSTQGARFIRTQDIKENYVNKDNMIYVDLPKHVEGKRTFVEVGDLLVTIIGSNIGKCALIDESFQEEGYVNQSIALIKPDKYVYSSYIHIFMQSSHAQHQIQEKIYGDAQPAINLKDIRNIDVPLPSIEEQKVIVAKVRKLLETIEDIRTNFVEIAEKSKDLEKAILLDVFTENEIHSASTDETLESILLILQKEKEVLELQRKEASRANIKMRQEIIKGMDRNRTLVEILNSNPNIVTEDLWKESMYFESRDVENFYEELSQLEISKTITTEFSDDSKTQTIIKLL